MIPRKISGKLKQLIENKSDFNDVILVEGARQVGKTTLIRETLKQLKVPFKEINLEEKKGLTEKIDLCESFEEFTELAAVEIGFRPGGEEILFIDEAQESRRLGSFVRFMKEKWKKTQVILSGSILSRIFRNDTRYPVGRITLLHLQPFSFEEFLLAGEQNALLEKVESFSLHSQISPNTHQRLLELVEQYMEVGGLPEVVLAYFDKRNWEKTREDILFGYYNDFKRIHGEDKQSYFVASLKAAAYLLGSPFKNSYVSSLLDGGKNQEIIKTLGQLETWKMIFKVDQRGPSVETHFYPKRYLFDLGIAKQLRETVIPATRLLKTLEARHRTPLGGIMENALAAALVSQRQELTGWKKSSSGSEIDFVVKLGDKIIPIECKAALTIKNSHLGGLRDFMRLHKTPKGIVVSLAPFEVRKLSGNQSVIILPLYLAERWGNSISPL